VLRIETGADPDPGFKFLLKLRDHYEVSMSELIGELPAREVATTSWQEDLIDRCERMPAERLKYLLEFAGVTSGATLQPHARSGLARRPSKAVSAAPKPKGPKKPSEVA
jgi:hypothetical protein